ncbi:hypothetical protein OIDMADRAFT_16592 [Oidiodendron maius Zn]|uniref:Uncharacterized protein n=1 Tax=Oidiodendron maius (strain Zn) TaxID=913774 RepID=A0A0C3I1M9_OIDMZ|nr:hypothetical protein OIDMADRAFT_16592 [Oidiodendron maius Zn]
MFPTSLDFAVSGQSQTTQGPRRAPKVEQRKAGTSGLRLRSDEKMNDKLMLCRARVR